MSPRLRRVRAAASNALLTARAFLSNDAVKSNTGRNNVRMMSHRKENLSVELTNVCLRKTRSFRSSVLLLKTEETQNSRRCSSSGCFCNADPHQEALSGGMCRPACLLNQTRKATKWRCNSSTWDESVDGKV